MEADGVCMEVPVMRDKIINNLRYWGQLFLLPVYWLSFFVPRNKNIWLFGSTFGRRFADNPRYFYLYVSQHSEIQSERLKERMEEWKRGTHAWVEDRACRDIRAVWLSHNRELVRFLQSRGYEAYEYHSVKGILLALRAGVYFFDNYAKDINFWQSAGALKINMWHGIPLKKIQADNRFDKIRHPKNLWEKIKYLPRHLSDEKPSHYVLATSEFVRPIFSSAFRTEHVLLSGYPRNDRLIADVFANELTEAEWAEYENLLRFLDGGKHRKMVFYMPTFRESESKFFDAIDLESFEEFLEKQNILFCVKLHPKSKLNERFRSISGISIRVIDKNADPCPFLEQTDVLVTDYSSVYFDFLLTGRPVVFFAYDLEIYLSDTREMYFDYAEFTPGQKAKDQVELQEAIALACKREKEEDWDESEKKRYDAMKAKVFAFPQGTASRKMVRDVKKILKIEE